MNELGINLTSLIGQLVNFVILFAIFYKFIFKGVLEIIDKQREAAKKTEEYERKINKEWENLETKKQQELIKAKKEISNLISLARQDAENQGNEIIDKAKKESREILAEADIEIKNKKLRMEKEIKHEAADLAVKIAGRLIARFLDKDQQNILVKKAIVDLKNQDNIFNE